MAAESRHRRAPNRNARSFEAQPPRRRTHMGCSGLIACACLLLASAALASDIFALPVAGTIKVGRTVSLSGQYTPESADVTMAADFWLRWANTQARLTRIRFLLILQAGGVMHNGSRYLFEFVTWNDASDPSLVPLLYKTMAETQGVTAFLGPYSSTLTYVCVATMNATLHAQRPQPRCAQRIPVRRNSLRRLCGLRPTYLQLGVRHSSHAIAMPGKRNYIVN